jgi:hypothetical protein
VPAELVLVLLADPVEPDPVPVLVDEELPVDAVPPELV